LRPRADRLAGGARTRPAAPSARREDGPSGRLGSALGWRGGGGLGAGPPRAAHPPARLWTSARALIVARADTRLPHFDAARSELERSGWPVAVRESGGSAAPHGPRILSL